MVRLAQGAKLRLTRRLDDDAVAARAGDRSTAEWIAREAGTSVGAARESLDASKRLTSQPNTDEALSNGELSENQATAISDAAASDPAAERKLVNAAKREGLKDLKKRCAETKANAHPDEKSRREAIRRGRHLRTFSDREGGWNLHMRHLPDVGAEIEALLAPYIHRRFECARHAGTSEPREAYAADALLDLARAAAGEGSRPQGARRADTKVLVHIDIASLLRGHTVPGSTCRIEGVGPVDVEWVRSIYGDAFVALLYEDAVDVRSVVHLGRQVTAHQRTALEARGYHCEVPGCGATSHLEIDHVDDWALTRRTVLDQLMWACPHHHRQKTLGGYRITGPPGARMWTAPGDTERRDHPPDESQPDRHRPGDQPDLFGNPSAA